MILLNDCLCWSFLLCLLSLLLLLRSSTNATVNNLHEVHVAILGMNGVGKSGEIY